MDQVLGLPIPDDPNVLNDIQALVLNHMRQRELEQEKLKNQSEFYARVLFVTRHPELAQAQDEGDLRTILSNISKTEFNIIESIRAHYGVDDIESIILGPNASNTSLGGHVISFSASAVVRPEDALHSSQPFGFLMLVKINLSQELSSAYRKKLRADADTLSRRLSGVVPPSLSSHFNPDNHLRDKAPWDAFLPPGGFLGLYQKDKKTLYLGVNAHAGVNIGSELSKFIHSQSMTARQIAMSPQVHWARHLARRNAQRLLFAFADHLGFTVDTVVNDDSAFVPKYHRRPKMVIPDFVSAYNTFVFHHPNDPSVPSPTVSFYHEMAEGLSSDSSHALIFGDAYQGIKAFKTLERGMRNDILNIFPVRVSELPASEIVPYTADVLEPIQKVVKSVADLGDGILHAVFQPLKQIAFADMAPSYGLNTSKEFYFKPVFVFTY